MLSSLSRDNKLVFSSLALWGVGEGLWWYLLPVYIESLGADPVQIGFVLSVSMIVMTLMFIPSGWVTDRVSRRPLMIGGWVMGSTAILLLADVADPRHLVEVASSYAPCGSCSSAGG